MRATILRALKAEGHLTPNGVLSFVGTSDDGPDIWVYYVPQHEDPTIILVHPGKAPEIEITYMPELISSGIHIPEIKDKEKQ